MDFVFCSYPVNLRFCGKIHNKAPITNQKTKRISKNELINKHDNHVTAKKLLRAQGSIRDHSYWFS